MKSFRIQLQEKSPAFDIIDRVQIDAIKFERTQINIFTDVFTAVVVVLTYALKGYHDGDGGENVA